MESLYIFAVIGGIISLIALIVFLVMACNIADLKRSSREQTKLLQKLVNSLGKQHWER